MSNDKQNMKVYTEEQVRKAIELARDTHPEGRDYLQREEYDYSDDGVIDLLTPIELPTNQEIEKEAEHEDTYSKKALLQEAQNGCGTEHLDATMSNNKQSSIMWLYEKMFVNHGRITIEEFEQAKAMHKDEHAATARDWWVEGASDAHKTSTGRYESFHDYYEKKFNQ